MSLIFLIFRKSSILIGLANFVFKLQVIFYILLFAQGGINNLEIFGGKKNIFLLPPVRCHACWEATKRDPITILLLCSSLALVAALILMASLRVYLCAFGLHLAPQRVCYYFGRLMRISNCLDSHASRNAFALPQPDDESEKTKEKI